MARACRCVTILLCTWVLWSQSLAGVKDHPWEPKEAYETKQECIRDRNQWLKMTEKRGLWIDFRCLPDTLKPK
jgi:hypothetical protein